MRRRQEQSIAKWGAEIASKLREQGVTGPDFTLFGFPQIKDATDNFSDENKLGEGGFGSVHKVTIYSSVFSCENQNHNISITAAPTCLHFK